MISGEIDVREKYTHYGDYNSRSYIATGIQVGSGIERETSCLIQAITKLATEFVSDKITNGTSKVSNGTNFNTVGLEILLMIKIRKILKKKLDLASMLLIKNLKMVKSLYTLNLMMAKAKQLFLDHCILYQERKQCL